MKYSGLVIGIPKEILPGERRASATPATVSVLVQQGATVLVETGAGAGRFSVMRLTPRPGQAHG